MNAPMRQSHDNIKTIYGKSRGYDIPQKMKKLLIGAEIVWFDKEPMSQNMDDALHFFFDSNTSIMTDLLLKKQGLTDVSQYVNIPLQWGVEMELHYSMPNREEHEKHHVEPHYFEFFGTIFPMTEKFKKHRDIFYMAKNLQFACVPDDHKNKKFYETTKFRAVVI